MQRRAELSLPALAAGILLVLTPDPAAAYMGPGGGLSLLTTALAMFAAFSVSAIVLLMWPVRAVKRWLRRGRNKEKADGSNADEERAEDKR
jgi:membrane protein implicated in regulation of membrane protease activity